MSLEVFSVENKRMQRKMFDLPWKLYDKDPYWVPPLRVSLNHLFSPKHPFYQNARTKMFVASSKQGIKGRIMGIINDAHNNFHEEKCGFFGFFESVNDQEVADSLFSQVENYLREQGMEKIRGPVNPSTNYECGLLISGFEDSPTIMMSYNPAFYQNLLTSRGFKKAKDLLAYNFNLAPDAMPKSLLEQFERIKKARGVTHRCINLRKWDEEVELIRDIYNDAWEKNWGFVPMDKKEFTDIASEMKQIIDPELVLFSMVKGKEAGFVMALPDYNQVFRKIPSGRLFPFGIFKLLRAKKHIDRCRLVTLGQKKKYNNLGVGYLLFNDLYKKMMEKGCYKFCEISWILEDNHRIVKPMLQIQKHAEPYKTYRIFEKVL